MTEASAITCEIPSPAEIKRRFYLIEGLSRHDVLDEFLRGFLDDLAMLQALGRRLLGPNVMFARDIGLMLRRAMRKMASNPDTADVGRVMAAMCAEPILEMLIADPAAYAVALEAYRGV